MAEPTVPPAATTKVPTERITTYARKAAAAGPFEAGAAARQASKASGNKANADDAGWTTMPKKNGGAKKPNDTDGKTGTPLPTSNDSTSQSPPGTPKTPAIASINPFDQIPEVSLDDVGSDGLTPLSSPPTTPQNTNKEPPVPFSPIKTRARRATEETTATNKGKQRERRSASPKKDSEANNVLDPSEEEWLADMVKEVEELRAKQRAARRAADAEEQERHHEPQPAEEPHRATPQPAGEPRRAERQPAKEAAQPGRMYTASVEEDQDMEEYDFFAHGRSSPGDTFFAQSRASNKPRPLFGSSLPSSSPARDGSATPTPSRPQAPANPPNPPHPDEPPIASSSRTTPSTPPTQGTDIQSRARAIAARILNANQASQRPSLGNKQTAEIQVQFTQGSMPQTHLLTPGAVLAHMDGEQLAEWLTVEGPVAIAVILWPQAPTGDQQDPRPTLTRNLINRYGNALSHCGNTDAQVAPPFVNPDEPRPEAHLVYNTSLKIVKSLIDKRILSTTEVTVRFCALEFQIPNYLGPVGGWSTTNAMLVRDIILKTLLKEDGQIFLGKLVAAGKVTRDDINNFLSSLEVVRLDTLGPGGVPAYRFNLYADSQYIADEDTWSAFRNNVLKLTYRANLYGVGRGLDFLTCSLCGGADDPRGLCPLPDIPDWHGPPHRLTDAQRGGRAPRGRGRGRGM